MLEITVRCVSCPALNPLKESLLSLTHIVCFTQCLRVACKHVITSWKRASAKQNGYLGTLQKHFPIGAKYKIKTARFIAVWGRHTSKFTRKAAGEKPAVWTSLCRTSVFSPEHSTMLLITSLLLNLDLRLLVTSIIRTIQMELGVENVLPSLLLMKHFQK